MGLILVLLVCSGLVSSSETALFSLDKLDVSQVRKSTIWMDRVIMRLLERPNDTLVTILILNNFVNIAISLTVGLTMSLVLRGAGALTFGLAAFVATASILIFGEIVPKILAHLNPHRSARLLAPPLLVAGVLLGPLRCLLQGLLQGLLHILRLPVDMRGTQKVSDEELKAMISSGEISSVLEEDEREMIDGVFELRYSVVSDILTPRMSLQALPDDLSQPEMLDRLRTIRHSRIPIYSRSQDNVIGFVLAKEVLLDEDGHWRNHLREALCVPERIGLLDLLRAFRRQHTKIALVVDEYGGVAGMVSLQDLLEEIVGDIYEQHETTEQVVQPIDTRKWRLSGQLMLETLGQQLDVTLPPHRGRTIGGFVMNTLGRIPEMGDSVEFEGFRFTVEKMSGRRVVELKAERLGEQGPDEGQGEGAS